MIQKKFGLQGLLNAKPVSINIVELPEVKLTTLSVSNGKLLMFEALEKISLQGWINDHKALVEQKFADDGLLLFRGFDVDGNTEFHALTHLLANELMDYAEPSTPRSKVAEKVYTSTEYPKEQFIPMHNEHSYSNNWPQKIWFYCAQPAAIGGATPVADSRKVYQFIAAPVREEFERKGVMYVRNFSNELDLTWQQVFQTENKSEVEAYCRRAGISYEWKEDGNLRTKQISQAVFNHLQTKERVWFNQAHLFHISNLEPGVQEFLIEQCGIDNVPRNSCFGDGSPIPEAYLEEIRKAYAQAQLIFDWQQSDVLMLDNVLYAHGRNPFSGERKVMVAMAEPYHHQANTADQETHQAVSTARRDTAQFFIKSSPLSQDHQAIKYKLAAAYRIMVTEKLDEGGISGHITMRVPGEPDAFWVNPFGLLAEEVTAHNLIKVDKSGKVLEGDHPVNVAGFCIHAAIHEAWPNLNCVAHTHSPWGTLYSSLGRKIEPIDQNCCLFFENHVLYNQYNGPVNDPEDAFNLAKSLAGMDVAVLRNHGTITCGSTIEAAVMRMVAVERAYRLNLLAMEHQPIHLVDEDTARLTREWIGNDIGFAIEFNALVRKVERVYPNFKQHEVFNNHGN